MFTTPFKLFDSERWPNNMDYKAKGGIGSTQGLNRMSEKEISRRHDLVRKKLTEMDCDLLMVQTHYQPTVMAVSTKVTWLTGSTGYRNCVTLILPKEGDLVVVHGRKPASNPSWITPYTQGQDMSPYIKSAKRIAYADTGYLGYQFRDYLLETVPGVEIVDFTNEMEHMMAVKSEEELLALRDSCEMQNRCWQAASTVMRPGRLMTDMRTDFHHMLLRMGMDPTLMPKILFFVHPNRPAMPHDNPLRTMDRDYRIQPDDFLDIGFETPGSGGYYAERMRHFFFDDPHPAIQAHYEDVLALHEYQMSLYKPGATMRYLRENINRYKVERGFVTENEIDNCQPIDDYTPELRGMGLLTVDRPQIQLEWEDLILEPGVVFTTVPIVTKKDRAQMKSFDLVVVTESGAADISPYPHGLFVL